MTNTLILGIITGINVVITVINVTNIVQNLRKLKVLRKRRTTDTL